MSAATPARYRRNRLQGSSTHLTVDRSRAASARLVSQLSATRAICAVALMLAAFTHRPLALPVYAGEDLAAYVLPDGSLPVLCLDDYDGDGKPDGISGHCEFCRIAASVDLPAPPQIADRGGLGTVFAVLAPGEDHIPPSGVPPSAPPRGPPSFRI